MRPRRRQEPSERWRRWGSFEAFYRKHTPFSGLTRQHVSPEKNRADKPLAGIWVTPAERTTVRRLITSTPRERGEHVNRYGASPDRDLRSRSSMAQRPTLADSVGAPTATRRHAGRSHRVPAVRPSLRNAMSGDRPLWRLRMRYVTQTGNQMQLRASIRHGVGDIFHAGLEIGRCAGKKVIRTAEHKRRRRDVGPVVDDRIQGTVPG